MVEPSVDPRDTLCTYSSRVGSVSTDPLKTHRIA